MWGVRGVRSDGERAVVPGTACYQPAHRDLRVWAFGFGFRVSGSGFRVSGFRIRVSDFGFRVSGFGFRASGFGFRVSGPPGPARRHSENAQHDVV